MRLPLQSIYIENYIGLSGPFRGYRCQNFCRKAQFCNFTIKCVNAAETNFPMNARNQNETALNAQTVTNNIRATSQDMKREQSIHKDNN
jgi:hypothetical protein